jgi:hypothetical protein
MAERGLRRDQRARTLMSMTRSIPASFREFRNGRYNTSTSSRPKVATVWSTAPLTASMSAASAWIASAFPPVPSMALTTAEAAPVSRT